jgi:hypothetical protein
MKNRLTQWIFYITLILFIFLIVGYIIYIQVIEYYQQLDPMLKIIQDTISPLDERVQTLQFYEGTKSYTINKKKIYLCLKDENDEYYDFNMLIYVALHELSHVLCDEIGHTPKFNKIFQQVLDQAEKLGIYDSTKSIIQNYCGHK